MKSVLIGPLAAGFSAAQTTQSTERIAFVPPADVTVEDSFWSPWIEAVKTTIIPGVLERCTDNLPVLYRGIEAASDAQLGSRLDDLIARIAAAQQPSDGSLHDAAAAYFRATGRRTLVDVALRNLDAAPEGLINLHEATGDPRCLERAQQLIAKGTGAVGAAVAGLARLQNNEQYAFAVGQAWEAVANQKMYLTGGAGSSPYELPNRTALCSASAAVAFADWSHRMFLLDGEARHIDVLERTVYNNLLAGTSAKGDAFSEANPLESDGRQAARKTWPGCAPAAADVARGILRTARYAYATRGTSVYVNLFVGGQASLKVGGETVRIRQETRYPWEGRVRITLQPERSTQFRLHIRIPGWALGRPVPGNLYRYLESPPEPVSPKVNERDYPNRMENGYAVIERRWGKGDRIEMDLPMPIHRVVAFDALKDDAGRVALERGPLVYCVEGADNGGSVLGLVLPDGALTRTARKELLGGLTVIEGDGIEGEKIRRFTAIPYYAWGNRGANEMAVWTKRAGR